MPPHPERIVFVPTPLWLLSLGLVMTGLVISGCGADAPAPSAGPSQAEATETAGTPRGVTPSTSAEPSVAPVAASAETPGKAAPASPAAAAPMEQVGQAPVKAPAPVNPSAEQLARWAISEEPPLEMLACYDGFSDHGVRCMAIAPDGREFCLGGAKVTLWKPSASEPAADLLADVASGEVERPILAIAVSPDGRWLAAGDSKGKLRIWDRSDRKEVAAIEAHEGRLTELAFSPDSSKLATTSYSGEVRLWDVSGKKLKNLKIDSQEIRSLVFCTDTFLATAGQEAAVWNLETGEKLATLTTGRVIGPAPRTLRRPPPARVRRLGREDEAVGRRSEEDDAGRHPHRRPPDRVLEGRPADRHHIRRWDNPDLGWTDEEDPAGDRC